MSAPLRLPLHLAGQIVPGEVDVDRLAEDQVVLPVRVVLEPVDPSEAGVDDAVEDSGEADALSTAVFLSQPEDALQLVESLDGVECILYTMDGQQYMTDGAKQYLASRGVDVNTP